jgi:RNA polymerase sigma-70 factor (ECF subfamily)
MFYHEVPEMMDESEMQHRLSRINTRWSVVFQAHAAGGQTVTAAQQELMQRYGGAMYRYILAAVRDPLVAEELCQEFALLFVQGNFKRVDPERGRFRDYVKTVLFHLVANWRRKQNREPQTYDAAVHEPAENAPPSQLSDEEFLSNWREELLGRTWEALEHIEQQTGQLYHTMLRFRATSPDVKSEQMAQQLGERLGKPLTATAVRQTVHRAREKFADLLLGEVARSLETQDTDRLEQELIDLGLLPYCQDALAKRRE